MSSHAEQIGLSPEEVISKIMANPDIAMAFQNPKVQAAIMEVRLNWQYYFLPSVISLPLVLTSSSLSLQCSQNPLSITKYQNDKEVRFELVIFMTSQYLLFVIISIR